jgi:hypothetical protein
MVYLQITLLLLVVLTQILRPGMVARWDRLWFSKLYLAISLGTTPGLILLSRLGVFGKNHTSAMPWQSALESFFFTVAVCFYLFCLRGGGSEGAKGMGEER